MSYLEPLAAIVLASVAVLAFYHHIGFPLFLRLVVKRQGGQSHYSPIVEYGDVLQMTVLMPAFNEAQSIAAKIKNLASLDYPADRLKVILVCDGCTDATADIARAAIADLGMAKPQFVLSEFTENRGKIAILNQFLPKITDGVVALTDVTAQLETDALMKAEAHFKSSRVGVVAGTYRMLNPGSAGEAAYWKYQVGVKVGEAALGAPLGVHGALYFIRAGLFQTLESDTINDDFVIPCRILEKGHGVIYDTTIVASETEQASSEVDFGRRKRIAAGNMQQVIRLSGLLSPAFKGIALAFFSGKALRALMPFLLAAFMIVSGLMAPVSTVWQVIFGLTLAVPCIALWRQLFPKANVPKIFDFVHYLVIGHLAGLIGGSRYLLGLEKGAWRRATQNSTASTISKGTTGIERAKRIFDLVGASTGLCIGALFAPFIFIAIKLDSPGPVLFRQMRVGRSWQTYTELFQMYKFRSMKVDAEKLTGPVWATKDDPRITKVGRFLRKTRLDEIPQLFNVIKGDMSLIGPRPERPGICHKLESAIPYYADRTYGVRPGITGLAQVFQGYDETIEDVRSKVSYDHAYALAVGSWRNWVRTDAEILWRTVGVVFGARGQ